MLNPQTAPGAYQPPFTLRRPDSLRDFERIAEHQSYWDALIGIRTHRPMQIAALETPALNTANHSLPFYKTQFGRHRCLNPNAKTWCFFLLEDRYRNIIGILLTAGIAKAAKDRHISPDSEELPVDDMPWSQLYVPDPARPETTRYAYAALLTDWRRKEFITPIIDAAYRLSDLFRMDVLFGQLAHENPNDLSSGLEAFGLRRIRVVHARTDKPTVVSVWAWEREGDKSFVPRHFGFALDVTSAQINALADFYQSLGKVDREELIYSVHGYTINARVENFGLGKRTIDERRRRIREALEEKGLERLGIDSSRGHDLSSWLCQPGVALTLKRIAWFYGELPNDL